MKRLNLVPNEPKFDFLRLRKAAAVLSALLVVGSLALAATLGLNLGIDFRGGTLIEVQTEGPAELPELRQRIEPLGLGDVSLQTFGKPNEILIRVQAQPGKRDQSDVIEAVRGALPDSVEFRRTEFVGPVVGNELIRQGAMAVALALGAILLYIWLRFEWQFGLGAVIALAHDITTTIGLFALTRLPFDLATVAAILTIAGYSINDTVVVYDRVRENMRRYKRKSLAELLNLSANQVLRRTVMTSLTTLLALAALAAFGGPIIRDFVVALIWGVVIGTYSSIFVAVPLLLTMNLEKTRRKNEQDEAGSKAERTTPSAG